MKIGILKEAAELKDKRVAFTPQQCVYIEQHYSNVTIVVQSSDWRCFTNEEYKNAGVKMVDDLSDCDLLIGIKQVAIDELIPNKKYLFFSHTLKKQASNKLLLQNILEKSIELIDYECLTDDSFHRIIGFGYFAGMVGTYNALLGYGKKYKLYNLKPAHLCFDKKELITELDKVRLPNIKLIVTGNGRVANGAIQLLGNLGIKRVTPFEFLNYSFLEPIYVQLHSHNYNEKSNGDAWNTEEFYDNPKNYRSSFSKYTKHCDVLVHCSYWDPRAPKLFSKRDMQMPQFKISVIADVTCDVNGSIPSTTQETSIEDKFYGYNPMTENNEEAFQGAQTITVMTIANLPCELPRNASEDFGKEMIEKVLYALLVNDKAMLIDRATITKNKALMPRFNYLKDYVD